MTRQLVGIFKYAAIVVVAVVVLIVVLRITDCTSSLPIVKGRVGETVTVSPADSSFAPILLRSFTPPLPLPGLSNPQAGVPARLPRGVRNKDVLQVVSLNIKGIDRPVDVIITKEGDVHVEKFPGLESVTSTTYNPEVIAFTLSAGIGVTLPFSEDGLSPSVKLSLLEIGGWLKVPSVVADLHGIGLGAEGKLYHDFYLGGAVMWSYEQPTEKTVKATLHFNI